MLLDAAFDLNLDLPSSFVIGDSERDILAGVNAGCTTIGVRTGYGLKKTSVLPDFFFHNLLEAVNFVVNEPYLQVYQKIRAGKSSSPALLIIGGKARCGKSTLAAYLKWKLEQEGRKVLKIELDNWILPEDQRGDCKNVYDRFQLPKIEMDIQHILAGMSKKIVRYAAHPERPKSETEYSYTGQDVIIIEGIVALSSEVLRTLASLSVYMDIDKQEHKKRIREYYEWRGKSSGEIEQLYGERLKDEYNLIEKERKLADLVVKTAK